MEGGRAGKRARERKREDEKGGKEERKREGGKKGRREGRKEGGSEERREGISILPFWS